MCHSGWKESDSPNYRTGRMLFSRFPFAGERHRWLTCKEGFIIFPGDTGAKQGLVSFYCQGDWWLWEETMRKLAVLTSLGFQVCPSERQGVWTQVNGMFTTEEATMGLKPRRCIAHPQGARHCTQHGVMNDWNAAELITFRTESARGRFYQGGPTIQLIRNTNMTV
jgi:hypothetical protein